MFCIHLVLIRKQLYKLLLNFVVKLMLKRAKLFSHNIFPGHNLTELKYVIVETIDTCVTFHCYQLLKYQLHLTQCSCRILIPKEDAGISQNKRLNFTFFVKLQNSEEWCKFIVSLQDEMLETLFYQSRKVMKQNQFVGIPCFFSSVEGLQRRNLPKNQHNFYVYWNDFRLHKS